MFRKSDYKNITSMNKYLIILSFILITLKATSQSGNGSEENPFYGTISTNIQWSVENPDYGSTVYIGTPEDHDLTVTTGGNLTIDPGITIIFTQLTSDLIITSSGILNAVGTVSDSIWFTKAPTEDHWGHISFETPGSPAPISGTGTFKYCSVTNGYAATTLTSTLPSNAGGGIQVNATGVTIENCLFKDNYSNFGGAITVNAGRNTVVKKSVFKSNYAYQCGGAILLWTNSIGTIENCIFEVNYCRGFSSSIYSGGAIWIYASNNSKVINSTFVNNDSYRRGDAIFTLNSAGSSIVNSVFWGTNDQFYSSGTASVVDYCAFSTTKPVTSTNSIVISSVADDHFNDATYSDWTLKFTSPCRDAGTTGYSAPTLDYMGTSRFGLPDIGAFENQHSRWTGASSATWGTATNWYLNMVPSSSSNVVVPNVSSDPIISSDVTLDNMVTESGGLITIESNNLFTATKLINAGSFILGPSAKGTISTIANNGTLWLESDETGISSLIVSSYSGNDADVQLYVTGGSAPTGRNWHYISSPFTSLSTDFFTGTTLNLAQWVESMAGINLLTGWVAFDGYMYGTTGTGPVFNNLAQAKGYNHYFTANHTYNLQGQLTTSNLTPSLSYTVTDPLQPTRYGLNVLGNPYSSGLDWDQIANHVDYPLNTSKGIYFNKSGTTVYYINGVGSEVGVTGVIPPMQGFFTKTYGPGYAITIPASARVHGTVLTRYKGAETIIPLVRINISSNGFEDNTVLRFAEEAKTGLDYDFDAMKLFISETMPYIYSVSSGTKYAINGQPFPETDFELPLTVNLTTTGTHTISASQLQGLDDYQVTLTDNTTGFNADLKTTPVITFSSDSALLTDRFILKVGKLTTGSEVIIASKGIFNIYSSFGNINIQTLADEWDGKTGSVSLLDLTGKTINSTENNYFAKTSLITVPANVTKGMYLVEIRAGVKRYVGKVVVR